MLSLNFDPTDELPNTGLGVSPSRSLGLLASSWVLPLPKVPSPSENVEPGETEVRLPVPGRPLPRSGESGGVKRGGNDAVLERTGDGGTECTVGGGGYCAACGATGVRGFSEGLF
jgi:hypothetical protein